MLLIVVLDCCAGDAMEVGDAQPAPASSERPSMSELALEARCQVQDAEVDDEPGEWWCHVLCCC